jgi:DNA polymerase III subunit delta
MITFKQLTEDLKNRIFKPVYLLMGDEPYYLDLVTGTMQNTILQESERSFNQLVLYGKDTDVISVINASRRFPMMSNYNLVILKEAQNLKSIEELSHYTEKPLASTILVISYKYKNLDARTKLYKSILAQGVVFESKKLYDDQVVGWIEKYLKARGYGIDATGGILLAEFLGSDLSKIAGELDKLILTLPQDSKKVTPSHIEKNIGISREYNNFELQKALIQKNPQKAFRIAAYFGDNQKNNPFILTVSSLYYLFSRLIAYNGVKDLSKKEIAAALKVNPYFLGDYELGYKNYPIHKSIRIISILREYDVKSKGIDNVSYSPGELLKEMIYKILHV